MSYQPNPNNLNLMPFESQQQLIARARALELQQRYQQQQQQRQLQLQRAQNTQNTQNTSNTHNRWERRNYHSTNDNRRNCSETNNYSQGGTQYMYNGTHKHFESRGGAMTIYEGGAPPAAAAAPAAPAAPMLAQAGQGMPRVQGLQAAPHFGGGGGGAPIVPQAGVQVGVQQGVPQGVGAMTGVQGGQAAQGLQAPRVGALGGGIMAGPAGPAGQGLQQGPYFGLGGGAPMVPPGMQGQRPQGGGNGGVQAQGLQGPRAGGMQGQGPMNAHNGPPNGNGLQGVQLGVQGAAALPVLRAHPPAGGGPQLALQRPPMAPNAVQFRHGLQGMPEAQLLGVQGNGANGGNGGNGGNGMISAQYQTDPMGQAPQFGYGQPPVLGGSSTMDHMLRPKFADNGDLEMSGTTVKKENEFKVQHNGAPYFESCYDDDSTESEDNAMGSWTASKQNRNSQNVDYDMININASGRNNGQSAMLPSTGMVGGGGVGSQGNVNFEMQRNYTHPMNPTNTGTAGGGGVGSQGNFMNQNGNRGNSNNQGNSVSNWQSQSYNSFEPNKQPPNRVFGGAGVGGSGGSNESNKYKIDN